MGLRFSRQVRIIKRDDVRSEPQREKSARQQLLDRRSVTIKELRKLNRELRENS